MYLFIDNSTEENIVLALGLNNKWVQRNFISEKEGLLEVIIRFLQEENLDLKNIKGMGVLLGKGRFTATRIAVTVSNTLAYALGIPVVGVKEFDEHSLESWIKASPVGQYVSAEYSGEVNVGKSKKK